MRRHSLLMLLLALPQVLAGQAPATHQFVPDRFYNTFSFAHPPALRIKPGDRVVTKTIDAGGTDWNGRSVATGPNPQTGPFYVEGAEPGDLLVVSIDRIALNRDDAYSSSLLAPYAVDPAAIAARVDREARRVTWQLDRGRGVARLSGPDISPALRAARQPDARVRRGRAGAEGSDCHQHARRVRRQHGLRRAWCRA